MLVESSNNQLHTGVLPVVKGLKTSYKYIYLHEFESKYELDFGYLIIFADRQTIMWTVIIFV